MINFNLKTQLTWRDIALRAAFIAVTVTVIVWLMPRDANLTYKVEKDAPWRYPDLTATFDFPVIKSPSAIEKEREVLKNAFYPYYDYDKDVKDRQVDLFRQDISAKRQEISYTDRNTIVNSLRSLYDKEIANVISPYGSDTIWLRRDGSEFYKVACKHLMTPDEACLRLMADPTMLRFKDVLEEMNVRKYIQPNYIYDSDFTQRTLSDLMASIAPSSRVVKQGQKIVSRGDIVDEDKAQAIDCYLKEYAKVNNTDKKGNTITGQALYVFILVLLFTIYLSIYRKEYFARWATACMLYALIIIFSLLAAFLVSHLLLHVYILPFVAAPIFVRVFMDSRTAFMTHVTILLICAIMLIHPLQFIAVELAGGMAVIFMLKELSSRAQLFWAALIFIASASAMRLALSLISNSQVSAIDIGDFYYLVVCGIELFCSYPLLYVVEKTFGFVSDITLIELSNTSRDLLRRMSEVAPGTFNHSIQVGNLAAEIARKIDGNAQLVRTGALYHDIGKIQNPIYFTENQAGGISPHEHLSYIDSAQYIIGHVTEGLKLADKYHLPRQIRDLIATHHGQGKAKYFYIKYKNEHPDEPVDELLFTYPGPNPFTKEQAILMMADAVEAASRSLPDYTEQSIRTLVERIIDSMVADGFFRECPITFRDIQYSKTVLIEKLKTIYHTRISYPEAKK